MRIRGGFTLQKLRIKNTTADFNEEKIQGPIVYAPHECGYAVIVIFSMFELKVLMTNIKN